MLPNSLNKKTATLHSGKNPYTIRTYPTTSNCPTAWSSLKICLKTNIPNFVKTLEEMKKPGTSIIKEKLHRYQSRL